ncbi:conserved hypothetical protein [Culex quinquefasciatus]|uniref:Zinc finger DNA binding protein n=1 Tax=Culex quinquefasciatus TaxID=7176 RepID=B0XHN4_CULQU|nr:conserved hypothetical protein [Culex quinquefasciatus]|eukprot:XP_001869156.1 conserved hypothetical protein [Culex quinquefasciatus]
MNINRPVTRSSSLNKLSTLALKNNINKRSRREIDEMGDDVSSLGDLWAKIQGLFEDTNSRIDSCKSDLEIRITSVEAKLLELKTDCSVSVKQVSERLDETRNDLYAVSNQLDRLERAHDLILNGVPFSQNEDLQVLFRMIAAKLAYNPANTPIVSLKRLSKQAITVGTSPPILCQFAIRNERIELYGRYLRSRNLTLRDVGFESNNRIFLNENLTPQAREVRSEALKLKKQGHLHQVYSRDGIVCVRSAAGADPVGVFSTGQLLELTI